MKNYLILLNTIIYNLLKDLDSFRNKLVILTAIFCFLAFKTNNATVIVSALSCWTIILTFYFYVRQKSQNKKK